MGDVLLIPLFGITFFFGTIVAIVALSLKFRARKLEHDEVMKAIESGQELPQIEVKKHFDFLRDMKVGIITLATGLGLFIFLSEGDYDMRDMAGIGAIPMFIGIGIIAMALITKHLKDKEQSELDKKEQN